MKWNFLSHFTEARAEIVGPTLKYLTPGSTLKLICKVLQSTEATAYIFWYHDNRMINYDLDRGINVSSEAGTVGKDSTQQIMAQNIFLSFFRASSSCSKIQFTPFILLLRLPLQRAYNPAHNKESFWELHVRSIQLTSSVGGCSHFQRWVYQHSSLSFSIKLGLKAWNFSHPWHFQNPQACEYDVYSKFLKQILPPPTHEQNQRKLKRFKCVHTQACVENIFSFDETFSAADTSTQLNLIFTEYLASSLMFSSDFNQFFSAESLRTSRREFTWKLLREAHRVRRPWRIHMLLAIFHNCFY